jgi:hypothetical protein
LLLRHLARSVAQLGVLVTKNRAQSSPLLLFSTQHLPSTALRTCPSRTCSHSPSIALPNRKRGRASTNQDDWRSLTINLARRGLSCSLTAVNFKARPRPGSTRFTTPSALICPSSTRNSSFTVEPKPFDVRVSINSPPRLMFPTREMSSIPAQRQSTQTFAGVSTREVNLLDGVAGLLKMINRPAVFQGRDIDVSRTLRAGTK